jgi:hypothetical protein
LPLLPEFNEVMNKDMMAAKKTNFIRMWYLLTQLQSPVTGWYAAGYVLPYEKAIPA